MINETKAGAITIQENSFKKYLCKDGERRKKWIARIEEENSKFKKANVIFKYWMTNGLWFFTAASIWVWTRYIEQPQLEIKKERSAFSKAGIARLMFLIAIMTFPISFILLIFIFKGSLILWVINSIFGVRKRKEIV